MYNLIKYGLATNKGDLKLAYSTLLIQSKNHMSAFIRKLDNQGVNFEPTYLSKKQFEDAISTGNSNRNKK